MASAGFLAALSTVLTWQRDGGLPITGLGHGGMDSDGFGPGNLVLIAAFAVIALGVARAFVAWSAWIGWASAAIGVVMLLVCALYYFVNVVDGENATGGFGLYLAVVASIAVIITGLLAGRLAPVEKVSER